VPRLNGPIDLRWDGAAYYILGTSIAEGKGYRLLNEPGEINSTLHQPLLPAIVAAHQLLLGTSDPVIVGQWLRYTFFLSFIIYIVAAYLMFRLFLTSNYAFIASIICLLHLNTFFLSDLLYAELLFAVTTVLFYFCHRKSNKKGYKYLIILLAMASYGLRTIGIALFAAWIGESLLNKDFKKAIFQLTILLIPILCWQSYVYSVEQSTQYQNPAYEYQRADYIYPNVSYVRNSSLIDSFAPEKGYITLTGRIRRITGNVLRIPLKLGEAISTNQKSAESQLNRTSQQLQLFLPSWLVSWFVFFTLLILGFLVIAGLVLKIMDKQWFVPLYILTYLAMMCLTPWSEQFGRYLMPLMPFLIVSLFETLKFLKTKSYSFLPPKLGRAGHLFAGSVLLLVLLAEAFTIHETYGNYFLPVSYNDKSGRKIEYKQFFYSQSSQNLDEGLDWLMARAEPGDIVAGTWSHWIYLRTGLKSVLPPLEANAEKAQNLLNAGPVKYLLLEKDEDKLEMKRYVSPIIENARNRWKLVFSTSDGELEIYERVRE
jgi:hypothetical protein